MNESLVCPVCQTFTRIILVTFSLAVSVQFHLMKVESHGMTGTAAAFFQKLFLVVSSESALVKICERETDLLEDFSLVLMFVCLTV